MPFPTLIVLLASAAVADSDEMFPGERQILEQIEQQDLAEQPPVQAEPAPESAVPTVVSPLDVNTSIESVREQGESFFDREGTLVIDPGMYDAIEAGDGVIPVPEVSPPTPIDEPFPPTPVEE